MYTFYYVTENGTKVQSTNLTRRKAVMLYNRFIRDMVINGYRTVGWKKED